MVDFSASQHVPEPPRKIKQTQFNEAEDEERTQKGDLEVLVQGEDTTQNTTQTTPFAFNPSNTTMVGYTSQHEGPEKMYSSEIPGQKPPEMGYDSKKDDISQGYHP